MRSLSGELEELGESFDHARCEVSWKIGAFLSRLILGAMR